MKDGFTLLTPELQPPPLDKLVGEIESQQVSFKHWATPGATRHAAALDLARTDLPPRRTPRLRLAGDGSIGERGDHRLSEPPRGLALALRPLDRNQSREVREPGQVRGDFM